MSTRVAEAAEEPRVRRGTGAAEQGGRHLFRGGKAAEEAWGQGHVDGGEGRAGQKSGSGRPQEGLCWVLEEQRGASSPGRGGWTRPGALRVRPSSLPGAGTSVLMRRALPASRGRGRRIWKGFSWLDSLAEEEAETRVK